MKDTLLSLASVIIPALLAWLAQAVQKHIKDARLSKLLDAASKLIEAAVASAFQMTVKGLKDPTKPGVFTPAAALAIKTQVIEQVKASAPEVMRELQDLGIETLDQVLGQLVEKHVVVLNATTAPPARAIAVVQPKPASVVEIGGNEP